MEATIYSIIGIKSLHCVPNDKVQSLLCRCTQQMCYFDCNKAEQDNVTNTDYLNG